MINENVEQLLRKNSDSDEYDQLLKNLSDTYFVKIFGNSSQISYPENSIDKNIALKSTLEIDEKSEIFTPLPDIALPVKNIQDAMKEIDELESERLKSSYLENKYFKSLQEAAAQLESIEKTIASIINNGKNLHFISDDLVRELEASHGNAVTAFNRAKKTFENEKENVSCREEGERNKLKLILEQQTKNLEKHIKDNTEKLEGICSHEENRLDSSEDDLTKGYIKKITETLKNLTTTLKLIIPNILKNDQNLTQLRDSIKDLFGEKFNEIFENSEKIFVDAFSDLKNELNNFFSSWKNEHKKLERQQLEKVNKDIGHFQETIEFFEKDCADIKKTDIQRFESGNPGYEKSIINAADIEASKGLNSINSDVSTIKKATAELLQATEFLSCSERKSLSAKDKKQFSEKIQLDFGNLVKRTWAAQELYRKEFFNHVIFFHTTLPLKTNEILSQIEVFIKGINNAKENPLLTTFTAKADDFLARLIALKESFEEALNKNLTEKK